MNVKAKVHDMLIPNVSKLPGHKKVDQKNSENGADRSEFKNLLKNNIDKVIDQHGIQLSLHAAKRIQERNLEMDSEEYLKLKDAFVKLSEKGGRESLVVTDKGAYILDVKNGKVITAMGKENLNENVFTKIDSTLILN